MKLRYWVAIWSALIILCIAVGFSTRAGYTNFSTKQTDVLNAPYFYSPQCANIDGTNYSALFGKSYSVLADKSQIVVTCCFDGTRNAQCKCYLSDVYVTKVIKGSQKLRGKTIRVYEPVYTCTRDVSQPKAWTDFNTIDAKFNWQGKKKAVISMPYGTEYCCNYTMMNKRGEYLLFLNPRQTLPEMSSGETNYVLLDDPYSKITISTLDAAAYQLPAKYISLKESMQYEILFRDKSNIKDYFDTKRAILNYLNFI